MKPAGWVEGMIAPTTSAPPGAEHGAGSSGAGSSGGSGQWVAPPQQTRHARRIYVGGLENVPESEIASFFNDIIRT